MIIVAALLLPWLWHVLQIPGVCDENYLSRLNPNNIYNGLQRLSLILKAIASHAIDITHWHLLWLLFPFLTIWSLLNIRSASPRFQLFFVTIVFYVAGIMLIYIISPWRDIAAHINATFDRVMLPILPVLIMLLLEALDLRTSKRIFDKK